MGLVILFHGRWVAAKRYEWRHQATGNSQKSGVSRIGDASGFAEGMLAVTLSALQLWNCPKTRRSPAGRSKMAA
jgi:hypothetical protein